VKIVSTNNIVDIEDPNMLDKIEEKSDNLMKACFFTTPIQKNICNFCLSNTKEREREKNNNNNNSSNNVFYNKYVLDENSQRKHFEGKFFLYFIFRIF